MDDEMSKLYDAATDYEWTVIEEVALRAGIYWRCDECGDNNRENMDHQVPAKVCGCGARRQMADA